MKLYRNTLFFLTIILFTSWNPYIPKKTTKEKALKGTVKTVIENISNLGDRYIIVQDYNTRGQLIEARFFSKEKKIIFDSISRSFYVPRQDKYFGLDTNQLQFSHKYQCFYNEKGLLIYEAQKSNDKLDSIRSEILYNYNEFDSLIRVVSKQFHKNILVITYDEKHEHLISKNIYEKVITENLKKPEYSITRIKFFYNKSNAVYKIKYNSTNNETEQNREEHYKYNRNNLIKSRETYTDFGKFKKVKKTIVYNFKYNKKGQITEIKTCDLIFKNDVKKNYLYDEYGNQTETRETEKKLYNKVYLETSNIYYDYYDSLSNVIKSKCILDNGTHTQTESWKRDKHGNWTWYSHTTNQKEDEVMERNIYYYE